MVHVVDGKLADHQHSEGDGKELLYKLATCGVSQGSIPGLMLLNVLKSDLDDGIKCSWMKFAKDLKLSREGRHFVRESHSTGRPG